MVELVHPPDPQFLLPPILACLPTAFASPRPPPALLPLLSPILRQRLSFISSSDNWLKLLCWDRGKSETLWEQLENATFEPHPVSGEIEVGDIDSIKYKRFDEETLRTQLSLTEWPFTPIFLWCSGSNDGSDGWKLTELLPSPDLDSSWSPSIPHANSTAKERIMSEALREANVSSSQEPNHASSNLPVPKEEEDYWAQYDQSPGRTPARKPSVPIDQQPTNEADYYARYAAVQPAMDNHDPDEEVRNGEQIESTLNSKSNNLQQLLSQSTISTLPTDRSPPPYQDQDDDDSSPVSPNRNPSQESDSKAPEVAQPHPSPPSSRGSDAITRLEDAAERYTYDHDYNAAVPAVKPTTESRWQMREHISTSLKSMYQLATSVGMGRGEFTDLVRQEVEGLTGMGTGTDD